MGCFADLEGVLDVGGGLNWDGARISTCCCGFVEGGCCWGTGHKLFALEGEI